MQQNHRARLPAWPLLAETAGVMEVMMIPKVMGKVTRILLTTRMKTFPPKKLGKSLKSTMKMTCSVQGGCA